MLLDNACKEYYGTASRAFIECIQEKGIDSVRQELRYGIDDFVADNAKECDGQVMRVAERFGLVYSALILACNLGVLGEHITLGNDKSRGYKVVLRHGSRIEGQKGTLKHSLCRTCERCS